MMCLKHKIICFLIIDVLAGVVCSLATPRLTRQTNDIGSDQTLILNIQDENKTQFLQQNTQKGEYEFGYNVLVPDGQYHHENRGPDNVTYGCYGYIDPFGKQVSIFYVSDQWGYRTVEPGKPVELFLHPHEHGEHHHPQPVSGNGVDDSSSGGEHHHHHEDAGQGGHHEHHEHHGEITQWENLHFPKSCGTPRVPPEQPPTRPPQTPPPTRPPIRPPTVPPTVPPTPPPTRPPTTPNQPDETPDDSNDSNINGNPDGLDESETPDGKEQCNLPGKPDCTPDTGIPNDGELCGIPGKPGCIPESEDSDDGEKCGVPGKPSCETEQPNEGEECSNLSCVPESENPNQGEQCGSPGQLSCVPNDDKCDGIDCENSDSTNGNEDVNDPCDKPGGCAVVPEPTPPSETTDGQEVCGGPFQPPCQPCNCAKGDYQCVQLCQEPTLCNCDKYDYQCQAACSSTTDYSTYPPVNCEIQGNCPYAPPTTPQTPFTYPPHTTAPPVSSEPEESEEQDGDGQPSSDNSHEAELPVKEVENESEKPTTTKEEEESNSHEVAKPGSETIDGNEITNKPGCNGCATCGGQCNSFPQVFIIPYPVPIVPSPSTCPCYLIQPDGSQTAATTTTTTQAPPANYPSLPPGAVLGYVPIVFYPTCSGNSNSQVIQPYFPQAYPVPYPCQQCNQNSNVDPKYTDPNLYPEIKLKSAFSEVINRSGLETKNIVKSPHRSKVSKTNAAKPIRNY